MSSNFVILRGNPLLHRLKEHLRSQEINDLILSRAKEFGKPAVGCGLDVEEMEPGSDFDFLVCKKRETHALERIKEYLRKNTGSDKKSSPRKIFLVYGAGHDFTKYSDDNIKIVKNSVADVDSGCLDLDLDRLNIHLKYEPENIQNRLDRTALFEQKKQIGLALADYRYVISKNPANKRAKKALKRLEEVPIADRKL